MTTHELKTWPEYFGAITDGTKTFEIRLNDRDFQPGDTLILREFDPKKVSVDPHTQCESPGGYTGQVLYRRVGYIFSSAAEPPARIWGLLLGRYVVISLLPDDDVTRDLGRAHGF